MKHSERELQTDYRSYRNVGFNGPSVGLAIGTATKLLKTGPVDGFFFLNLNMTAASLPIGSGALVGSYDVALSLNLAPSVLVRIGMRESTLWDNGFLDSNYSQYYGSFSFYTQ